MKNSKLFYLSILILPWITVPLLGRSSFEKYLPAAIFISTFTKAINLFGEKKKWWRYYTGLPHLSSGNFLNFGPYFVTSLWMLKMNFGKFKRFLISNMILHVCFIFLGGVKLADHYKIFTLKKLTKFQYFMVDFLRSLLLYTFQYINNIMHNKKCINE